MTPKQNQLNERIIRIDESINGPNGLLHQVQQLQSDVSSVKLVVAGGIGPDGKDCPGLITTIYAHLDDHKRMEKNRRRMQKRNNAIIIAVATLIASSVRELLRYFHVG